MDKTIRTLVVDDSRLYREIISVGISSDPRIKVVATAVDPFDARDKIIEYKPDVMICDIQMPKMNGIEFVRRLLPQYPIPIIIISTITDAVFDAMGVGAVDFVGKPDDKSPKSVECFIIELIEKVKIATNVKVTHPVLTKMISSGHVLNNNHNRIIAIGASTGGTEAITSILKALIPDIPGIVIVQHIPPVFSKMFADRLNSTTDFCVKEAENGDIVEPGKVLVAAGDKHLRIKKNGSIFKVECFEGENVTGHCPSVDVLFDSVAKEAGQSALGIILTGMGYDGAKGLLAMKRKGARTIGQDSASAVVYGMPKVAYDIGAVEKQVSLNQIPQFIYKILADMEAER